MAALLLVCVFAAVACGLRWDPAYVAYNLNENQQATDPLQYSAERPGHKYFPSPDDWRFPFYTLFLDRLANGDPSNDNINGTLYEQDITSNQLRHGGDIQGLVDSLDYIQGMGMKGIYIAGSPFINLPWGVDSYSPVDLTLLDPHYGTIEQWQDMVDAVHERGMYIMLDHTMSTMSDLLSFEGFENVTAPFQVNEHRVNYKGSRRYLDFQPSNNYLEQCEYPRFWDEQGLPVSHESTGLKGCYESDFDQYGDIEAFGLHPDWKRSLAKFASVQDRLREWVPSVRDKIAHFSCLTIIMLDIDGFRFDKATQITVDALGEHNDAVRQCAKKLGKNNFFLPGEITGGNDYGSIYIGRGRQPDMRPETLTKAIHLTTKDLNEQKNLTIRDEGKGALDAGAFHYSTYRFLTRFVGMSGNLEAGYDLPRDWVEMWNQMLLSNDFVNPNTGKFDPRHMYGTMNQDVFRWSGITQGTERMLLGLFLSTLHMPGIPLVFYGEEQEFYVLDSTADNYIFGRQAVSPTQAWMLHGCHAGNSTQYIDWPIDKARTGCLDPKVALDHRDPSAPVRNIMKAMYNMRDNFGTFRDGWLLQALGKQTREVLLPGSNTTTELGIFSVVRAYMQNQPDLNNPFVAQPVWLVYHNQNETTDYEFDCSDVDKAFFAPFDEGLKVKNLFFPYDEITLENSPKSFGFMGSTKDSGCVSKIQMKPFEFRAYVMATDWEGAPPMITKFSPGHDASLDADEILGTAQIAIEFSEIMDCESVGAAISVSSTVEQSDEFVLLSDEFCQTISSTPVSSYTGSIPSRWRFTASLTNLHDGIHKITISKPNSTDGASTNSVDHFFIRVGRLNNPIVYPGSANYSTTLVTREGNDLFVNHAAAGADKWRYTTNWGSSWSEWTDYKGGKQRVAPLPWSGTKLQEWEGDHVIVQYWSKMLGSGSFKQEGDSTPQKARRFPHLFLHGTHNKFGFDAGIKNQLTLNADGRWEVHLMDEWPTQFQLNVWGMNPDGKPDAGFVYGDVEGDGVLDRMPPSSLALNVLNASEPPPLPALAYKLIFDDATLSFIKEPQGNIAVQIVLFILLAVLPVVGGAIAVWIFMGSFYRVKINEIGFKRRGRSPLRGMGDRLSAGFESFRHKDEEGMELGAISTNKRRKVIIATMEYNIDDWNIKIKIGGLGVMAQLMGKALEHQDLIWVVPCVGGIDYPVDQRAEPMYVNIMGNEYEIEVQYHQVQNITYVLLDAPIFRQQTKTDPYPPRMDDIDSAIYYSAWNFCIAETIKRFNPDLYHINDYHGAAAPLYLLPGRTIPCALSLHNAEFQGMWPMRNPEESKEVCEVFNLDPEIVKEYVQFGSVFNLLHAGASYLRVHQKGFGAVGVSKKYGDRSYARYPIFWGLSKVGQLPNPDPSDTAEWSRDEEVKEKDVVIDFEAESKRGDLRKQAQEWAGLEVNPDAELFVFVGRWSLQKGVDLIADIFPSILEKYPTTQLICIGPVIDLYGKFAALKLAKLMERYPKRVYSKPEFTSLPPYIFSGAEFALIPSRDEPFGLVAVEFGRKGALGVGARVGGLGQMPGFWYTVESTAPQHLLHQFREAIVSALECKPKTRQKMRAWSGKQRFPVAQWVGDLDKLQSEAIRLHNREAKKHKRIGSGSRLAVPSSTSRPYTDDLDLAPPRPSTSSRHSRASSLSVPFITETDHDVEQGRRSVSNPYYDRPGSATPPRSMPGTPPQGAPSTPPTGNEPFMRPHPLYANPSAASSVSSLATIAANDPNQSQLSVDSFAMRIMSPDGSETRPHPFGLYSARPGIYQDRSRNSSRLSVVDVVGDRHDLKLQKVDPFFTDSTGEYYQEFEQKLLGLTPKNSDTELCIDDFLKKSEKKWFQEFRDAKLGRNRSPSRTRSPAPSLMAAKKKSRVVSAVSVQTISPSDDEGDDDQQQGTHRDDEFLLGEGYKPPTGLKKFLSLRVGDWPVYSLVLSLGQIMSANSYQIVLLVGEAGQSEKQLYIVAGTYAITSTLWWLMFRRMQALYSLTLPWAFYGLAFLLLGITPFLPEGSRAAMQNAATALYAAGASSGSLFFALNFGDEGGAPIMTWIFRAAVIQGIQQLYIIGLWFWGSLITAQTPTGLVNGSYIANQVPTVLVITVPIAFFLFALGYMSYVGLPDYYRQSPDKIPSFYMSLLRRHVIPWFFFYVVVQNYWLTTTYGRSWEFLFKTKALPGYSVLLLSIGFFAVLWILLLWLFSFLSKTHPWIVPLFAIGLGAPRWAQMLWGTSGIGLYLPWLGNAVVSALASRGLWLWLGVLDTVQGVGLGMVLLLTLTRQHVAATLTAAQILGAGFTILARGTAPHKIGPAEVFPDFSEGVLPGVGKPFFWVCLILQLILPIGFFKFFRKEQVAKP